MFPASINAHREGGFIGIGVAVHHQGKVQLIEPCPLHGEADQPACLGGHEIDRLRGRKLSRADEITFIFTLFVIDHHHAGTVADGGKGIGNRIESQEPDVEESIVIIDTCTIRRGCGRPWTAAIHLC